MDNQQLKDFYRQFAGQIARFILVGIGTFLESYQVITHDTAVKLSSADVVVQLVALIFFVAPVLWAIAKSRWNVKFPKDAANAPQGTPIEQIKTDSIEKHSFVSSV